MTDIYQKEASMAGAERIIIKAMRSFIKTACTNGVLKDMFHLVGVRKDLNCLSC